MAKPRLLVPQHCSGRCAVGWQLVALVGLAFSTTLSRGTEQPSSVWSAWLQRQVLTDADPNDTLRRFVEDQLKPHPLPDGRAGWAARRETLHGLVLTTLGLDDLVPPRWDLSVRPKGTLQREGYSIEKITFESYPGMAVPALIYVPEKTAGRVPGIVSIAGHNYGAGKAAEFLQRRNVNLCLRGCVVLSYDYIDTGERNTGPDALAGKPYGGGNDHFIRSFSFSRRNPTGLEVLDAMRAVDALVSRPDVDATRIGFTGESGGGNSTYWIAALDPRVKLAVPVSSVTSFDYWIRMNRNWDWHQRPTGIRRVADIGVLLALHAPRPLLVISSKRGTDDQEFPWEEAHKSVSWARHVYRLHDADDAISHVESTTAHGYQADKRRHLYRAVERWLVPAIPLGDKELACNIEAFDDLRCRLPKNNLTFLDIYNQWLKPLPRTPDNPPPEDLPALRTSLRDRLGLPASAGEATGKQVGNEERDGFYAEFWTIESEPGIRLPCVLIGARRARETPSSIVLIPGRDAAAVKQSLEAGHRIFAFDPRGTGEVEADLGVLRNWSWFAGRPITGQWALDITQAARFARRQFQAHAKTKDLFIVARHKFGYATLLAGAAQPELFQSGEVVLAAASLKEIIDAQGSSAQAQIPGLLERIDIRQLRAMWPKVKIQ